MPAWLPGSLRDLTGVPVVESQNLVEATQDAGAYVQLSGVLKTRGGEAFKNLQRFAPAFLRATRRARRDQPAAPWRRARRSCPARSTRSFPRWSTRWRFEVIGNDVTVTMAAEAGQLELNVMEPVIAFNLFSSIDMLGRSCRTLAERCIRGITANREVLPPHGGTQHRAGHRPEPGDRV